MITEVKSDKIEEILLQGSENRSLEFKSDFNWATDILVKEEVIKAIMGMCNKRDGGVVFLGVKHKQGKKGKGSKILLPGCLEKNKNWIIKNWEKVEQDVFRFSSRNISLNFKHGYYGENKMLFCYFEIGEFDDYPIICKENGRAQNDDGKRVLQKDAVYVRSKNPPWSTISVGWLEFEELIQVAADRERAILRKRGYVKQNSFMNQLVEERKLYE